MMTASQFTTYSTNGNAVPQHRDSKGDINFTAPHRFWNVNLAEAQSTPNIARGDTKFGSDLSSRQASTRHLNSLVDPRRRLRVFVSMSLACGHNLQIVRMVIPSIAINVMDFFASAKRASDLHGRNMPMFIDTNSIDDDLPVERGCMPATVDCTARPVTELWAPRHQSGMPQIVLATVGALDEQLFHDANNSARHH